jgi:hypothetical protein
LQGQFELGRPDKILQVIVAPYSSQVRDGLRTNVLRTKVLCRILLDGFAFTGSIMTCPECFSSSGCIPTTLFLTSASAARKCGKDATIGMPATVEVIHA